MNKYSKCYLAVLLSMQIAALLGCKRSELRELEARGHSQLSPNLWLHRTSAAIVVLTDKDGVGLVDGNITHFGIIANDKGKLAFKYVQFDAPIGLSNHIVKCVIANKTSGSIESVTNLPIEWLSIGVDHR
jgi:hypothetical protein